MRTAVLLVAVVLLGLMAGLFYAYAGSVMPGLRRADDRTVVDAMQRINVAILNPLFGVIFVGALVASGVAVFAHSGEARVFVPMLVAFLLYAATLLITFTLNIPLNNRLAVADVNDPAPAREEFLPAWTRWNMLRAVTSVGAFAAACWALYQA